MKRYFIDDGPENEDWPKRTDDLIDYPLVFPSAVVASVTFDATGNFVLACEAHGEFACKSKACAPPPVGTGGSLPSGRSRSGGGGKRRTEFGKRIAKMIADDPELAAFSRERSDPEMRRKAAYVEYRSKLREAIARPIGSPDRNLLDPLVRVSGTSDPAVVQYVLDLFKPEMLEPEFWSKKGHTLSPDERQVFLAVHKVLLDDEKRESMGGILSIDGKTVYFFLDLDNATVGEMRQPPISTERTLMSVLSVGRAVREEVETRLLRTLNSQRERAGAESARWHSEMQAIGKEFAEKFPGAKIDLSKVFYMNGKGKVIVPSNALEGSKGSAYMRRDEIEEFLSEQMVQRKLLHLSDGARHLMLMDSEEISRVVADTLKEVRKFGGKPSATPEPLAPKTVRKSLRSTLQQGAEGLPSAWIDVSNKHGDMRIVFTAGRAQYDPYLSEVQIGVDVDVARHELAHRMESVVPGLLGLEERFFKFRTGDNPTFRSLNELVGSKNQYRDNEVADPDQFFNPYVGKDYKGVAYEIMSVGVQHVYRHLVTKMSTQGDMIQTQKLMDDEYIDFVLGAMMTVQWEE